MAEQANEKIQIKLHVYDTNFPVNIHPDDEPLYRNAAKLITDTVGNYFTHFQGLKSEKEILFMALIEIALRYQKATQNNDTQPYDDILDKLTTEIEQALKS